MGFLKRLKDRAYMVQDRDEAMTVLEMADELEAKGRRQEADAYRLAVLPELREEYEAMKRS